MCENLDRIHERFRSAEGAYEHARDIAKRAVGYEKIDAKTNEAAIESLTRRGRFGSWLRKLHGGDRVSVHLHHYFALVAILEEQVRLHEQRLAHERTLLRTIKGIPHAADQSLSSSSGAAGAPRLRAV